VVVAVSAELFEQDVFEVAGAVQLVLLWVFSEVPVVYEPVFI